MSAAIPPDELGDATLKLPRSVVGSDQSIERFVHPENGADPASETMHVRPGEHLGLRVPAR